MMKNFIRYFPESYLNGIIISIFLTCLIFCSCEKNDAPPQHTKEIEVMESRLFGKWVSNEIRKYNDENFYRSVMFYFQPNHLGLSTRLRYPALLDTFTWKITYSEKMNEYELSISQFSAIPDQLNLYIKSISDTLFNAVPDISYLYTEIPQYPFRKLTKSVNELYNYDSIQHALTGIWDVDEFFYSYSPHQQLRMGGLTYKFNNDGTGIVSHYSTAYMLPDTFTWDLVMDTLLNYPIIHLKRVHDIYTGGPYPMQLHLKSISDSVILTQDAEDFMISLKRVN